MAIGDNFTDSVINQNLNNVGFSVQQRDSLKRLLDAIQADFTEASTTITNLGLGDLSDVSATVSADALNGEQLTWVDANSQWEPGTA